jgi:hypothetical protein
MGRNEVRTVARSARKACAGYLEYPFQNKQELCSISQAVPGISPGKERKREIRLMETTRFLNGCSK